MSDVLPSPLAQIQRDFQDYVLGAGDGAIAAAVADQVGLDAQERLAIYFNAYRLRLREALSDAYGKTWSYVGDDLFAAICSGYVDAHPSTFRNLRWFGSAFADFLAENWSDYPFIAELARFEWALGTAFDAPDVAALSAASLADVAPHAWGELVFALHPSVQLLPMAWNAVALWQALEHEQAPPDAIEAPACWLVWRCENQPHFRSLGALEAQALHMLGRGASFGAVCASAFDGAGGTSDITLQIAGFLQNWLAQGLLSAPAAPPQAL